MKTEATISSKKINRVFLILKDLAQQVNERLQELLSIEKAASLQSGFLNAING
jgi:hypothetical protein